MTTGPPCSERKKPDSLFFYVRSFARVHACSPRERKVANIWAHKVRTVSDRGDGRQPCNRVIHMCRSLEARERRYTIVSNPDRVENTSAVSFRSDYSRDFLKFSFTAGYKIYRLWASARRARSKTRGIYKTRDEKL